MTPTVLVVEDDDDLREAISAMLELGGPYRVVAAADGARALETIARARPDLILLDMKMPVMNGWELAEALARDEKRIPIVVLTATEDARRHAEEIGAQGWLAKPFELADLLAMVARHLGEPDPTG